MVRGMRGDGKGHVWVTVMGMRSDGTGHAGWRGSCLLLSVFSRVHNQSTTQPPLPASLLPLLLSPPDQSFLQKLAGWKSTKDAVTDCNEDLDRILDLLRTALALDSNVTVRQILAGQQYLLGVAVHAAGTVY